jgi:hypothetical protein
MASETRRRSRGSIGELTHFSFHRRREIVSLLPSLRESVCALGAWALIDPALHAALVDVFQGAIPIERFESRWMAIPHLGP